MVIIAAVIRVLCEFNYLHLPGKSLGYRRYLASSFFPLRMQLTELEIPHIVKYDEFLFIISRAKQILAKPGAASYHLVKLDTAVHLLGKYQIHHLRYIYSGLQLIYSHGYKG